MSSFLNKDIIIIINIIIIIITIANGFPRINNTSFVCPKLATVYEVCHIRYKSMGTIMKAVTFVVCNA